MIHTHTDTRSLIKSKKKYKEARSKLTFTQKKKTIKSIHTHTSEEREGGNGYLCAIYFFPFFCVLRQKQTSAEFSEFPILRKE